MTHPRKSFLPVPYETARTLARIAVLGMLGSIKSEELDSKLLAMRAEQSNDSKAIEHVNGLIIRGEGRTAQQCEMIKTLATEWSIGPQDVGFLGDLLRDILAGHHDF
jgi:hypothetical protein